MLATRDHDRPFTDNLAHRGDKTFLTETNSPCVGGDCEPTRTSSVEGKIMRFSLFIHTF